MTAAVAKFAAKSMLKGEMNKYKDKDVSGSYDPFYERIPDAKRPGKTKKVKKLIPSYIPEPEADILARARKTAYKLDCCLFNFLGLRFGWSSVIGLAPAIGDGIDALLALKLIHSMTKIENGLPWFIWLRMLFNMAIDFLVGLVPFVGDLADAAVKCNSRNVRLFEQHLDRVYKPKGRTKQEKNMGFEPSPATVYEDFSSEEGEPRAASDPPHGPVQRPAPTHSSRSRKILDEEMGHPRHETQRSRKPEKERSSRSNPRGTRRH